MSFMRCILGSWMMIAAILPWSLPAANGEDVTVPVFDEAPIQYDRMLVDGTERDGLRVYHSGQVIERTIELPSLPPNQRDAKRITATLILQPVVLEKEGKRRPADPWPRVGSVTLVLPREPQAATTAPAAATGAAATRPAAGPGANPAPANPVQLAPPPAEVEIMRFITGFGGPGTFTQDVTALAPLLHGKATVHVLVSTFMTPAWEVTLTLNYKDEGAGFRRPVWAKPLFHDDSVTAQRSKLKTELEIPAGLARPRLQFITTGHASDGTGGDEFVTRTHVLRIDDREVARWRPWAEDGGSLRAINPMSGRKSVDGRELWSCDLDRSGWRPGLVVEPLRVPLPELTPGRHTIELEVQNIRPTDQFGNHGYWRVSCIALADEPWPDDDQPQH